MRGTLRVPGSHAHGDAQHSEQWEERPSFLDRLVGTWGQGDQGEWGHPGPGAAMQGTNTLHLMQTTMGVHGGGACGRCQSSPIAPPKIEAKPQRLTVARAAAKVYGPRYGLRCWRWQGCMVVWFACGVCGCTVAPWQDMRCSPVISSSGRRADDQPTRGGGLCNPSNHRRLLGPRGGGCGAGRRYTCHRHPAPTLRSGR